jgi:hypothetical protein
MSLLDCIAKAESEGPANGGLTKEQAKKARDLFIDFKVNNEANMKMGPADADAKAGKDTFDVLEYEAFQSKRRMILQRATLTRALKNLEAYKGPNKGEAMVAFLERDGKGLSPYSNVAGRQAVVRGMAHSLMSDVFSQLRKTQVTGRTTRKARAKSNTMLREVFGENTGDQAAKDLALAWERAAEFLRLSFNKAGGDIPKRQGGYMPQVHDNGAIRKAGAKTWKDFIRPLLDQENMASFKTDKPMTLLEFEDALDEVWETIATEGFSKIKQTSVGGQGKSLARRRQDHRFLLFKDADSFSKYNDEFGSGDVFTTMMNHIDGMSRDVALLEILGPNPNSTINYLKTQVTKQAKEVDAKNNNSKAGSKLQGSFDRFDDMFDYISGKAHTPSNEGVARTFAGLGNLLTAAYLGSTSILAIATDPNFTRIAKRMSGMPVWKSSMKKSFAMMTANKTTKQQAIRMGLIAENWSGVAYGQARYAGEIMGGRVSEAISTTAMNLSLLSPFTQAGRWSFGMEFMGFIADNAAKPYSALNQPFKDTLERFGISEADWGKMASFEQYDFKGAKFLRPDEMMEADRDLAFKTLEMIQGMTNLAVPVSSVRARSTLVGNTRAGTMSGELVRSFAMFKNFPVTFYQNNMMAAIYQKGTGRKLAIASDLFISTSAMAALSIQMREFTKGRDPLPMDTAEFWGSAILTGGGFGILGDFLFAGVNRFGGGLVETAAGPRTGFLNSLRDLTLGNVQQVIKGKDTNFARESIDFFGRNLPGASTWYLRLAIERGIMDQLRLVSDPKAYKRFRQLERGRIRDYDQEYWWRPGQVLPDRPPNVLSVTGR